MHLAGKSVLKWLTVRLVLLSGTGYSYSELLSITAALPATDAVGRKLPTHREVGGVKSGKFVGLFYWTWHMNFISLPAGDPAWMRLFIDADPNKETGWECYDFAVNRLTPSKEAVVEKSKNGWNLEKVGTVAFTVLDNKLELRIPREVLSAEKVINLEFNWSDNMQADGEIMDFWINGDVAPAGRFNYMFTAE